MTTDTYYANGNEVQLFEQAYHQRLPVMLTGPTGAARRGSSSTWACCCDGRSSPSAAMTI